MGTDTVAALLMELRLSFEVAFFLYPDIHKSITEKSLKLFSTINSVLYIYSTLDLGAAFT